MYNYNVSIKKKVESGSDVRYRLSFGFVLGKLFILMSRSTLMGDHWED
jgi:hypothetical protein